MGPAHISTWNPARFITPFGAVEDKKIRVLTGREEQEKNESEGEGGSLETE